MNNDNMITFMDAMLYAMEGESSSKAIENQEKRGQQSVIRNQRLPKRLNDYSLPDGIRWNGVEDSMDWEERNKIVTQNNIKYTRQQYEKMDIAIIDECDDLFYNVVLPEGWKIEATDHSMWNDLFDNKGRKRATFFYKAAFYDRDAFINFEHRYSFKISPFDNYESNADYNERKFKPWKLFITDCEEKIKELQELTANTNSEYLKINDILKEIGIKYLNENYPEWMDINAYWD